MLGSDPKRAVERCDRLAKLGRPPAWWRVFALRRWLRAYRAIMALDISALGEMMRAAYPAVSVDEMAQRRNVMFERMTKALSEPAKPS